MKEIALTKNKVALIDDEDFEYASKYKWYAQQTQGGFYAARASVIDGERKIILLHRELMNVKDSKIVDHRNHNTLDCQRANLRIGTQSLNGANTRKGKGTSSKYKGVYYSKSLEKLNRKNRWVSEIMVKRSKIYLGSFASEIEAALVYDHNAVSWFGEFALTNSDMFPEDFKELK